MSDNIPALDNSSFSEDHAADAARTRRRLRSHCPEGFDERIQITSVVNGYCHCRYEGTCDPSVTEADIAKLFCHPEWGGRSISVANGRFAVTRHLD